MTDTYSAGEFLKKLTEGALRAPLICEGFAKPVEGSHEAFLFSLGRSCEDWTKIPIEIVENVKFLGERSCRDHSHPFIQIHFKEPSAKEPSAAVFASLLRASNREPIPTRLLPIVVGRASTREFQDWIDDTQAAFEAGLSSDDPREGPDILWNRNHYILLRKCRGQFPYQGLSPSERRRACRLLAEE
jgi:hypothetical protein